MAKQKTETIQKIKHQKPNPYPFTRLYFGDRFGIRSWTRKRFFTDITMHVTSIENKSKGQESIIEVNGRYKNGKEGRIFGINRKNPNPDIDKVLGLECNRDYMIISRNGFWIVPRL